MPYNLRRIALNKEYILCEQLIRDTLERSECVRRPKNFFQYMLFLKRCHPRRRRGSCRVDKMFVVKVYSKLSPRTYYRSDFAKKAKVTSGTRAFISLIVALQFRLTGQSSSYYVKTRSFTRLVCALCCKTVRLFCVFKYNVRTNS